MVCGGEARMGGEMRRWKLVEALKRAKDQIACTLQWGMRTSGSEPKLKGGRGSPHGSIREKGELTG